MHGEFSFVAEPGQPVLVMMQSFEAARADVFAAWTNPDEVAQWWDPTGSPLAVCEIDLRPNGAFRWVNQGDTGLTHPFTGTYREIVPPERLVFEGGISPNGPRQLSTLTFVENDGSTTLTITIECQSVEQRDAMLTMRMEIGTERTLLNLAAHLDRRPH